MLIVHNYVYNQGMFDIVKSSWRRISFAAMIVEANFL